MLPLEGIRVLDFTQLIAGAFSTMLLGDLGADVIKIEPPEGDAMRRTGNTSVEGLLESEASLSLSRNKRSVVLDLKSAAGKRAALDLAAQADIVVENFRPGTMDKLGLGYDELSRSNPGLIFCAVAGFRPNSKYAKRPALDQVIQALSGLMQLNGSEESGPLRTGFPFVDIFSPTLATIGILAALHRRELTGEGGRVDMSMMDAAIFGMIPREGYYFKTGKTPARIGNKHYQIVPCDSYTTSDNRQIQIIAHQEKFWHTLTDALADPELADDPRFLTNALRNDNRDAVDEWLARIIATKPLSEWLDRFEKSGVLFAPVRTLDEVFSDPEVRNDMVVNVNHSQIGTIKVLANPINISGCDTRYEVPPPMLGEHTDDVIDENGNVLPNAWRKSRK